jgi:surface antigen
MAILDPAIMSRMKLAGMLLVALLAAGCTTTSGSDRLDETGEQMAEATDTSEPETSAFYIQALKGGLVSKIADIKLSTADRSRALEAEYKVLESTPSGQTVAWEGSGGMKGQVIAAVPYQVGSQNCRQYSHSITLRAGAEPKLARGAACRNANGSWTPL